MQGSITFDGTLSGGITGGGGGGSEVTITPVLTEGTKIADYEIDGDEGSLYAPTPEGLTAQEPLEISNDTISIDLSDYTTYEYTESRYTPLATFNAYTIAAESHFQRTLTAGSNITIDPVTDTISASNNYSSNEQVVGTWFGKTLYRRAYHFDQSNLPTDRYNFDEILNVNEVIKITGVYNWLNFQDASNLDIRCYALGENSPQASDKAIWLLMEGSDNTGINFYLDFNFNGKDRSKILKMCAFVEYTKTTD